MDNQHTTAEHSVFYTQGPKKYYWISYLEDGGLRNICHELHPFDLIDKLNRSQEIKVTVPDGLDELFNKPRYELLNWKNISVEEYNLYNELKEKV